MLKVFTIRKAANRFHRLLQVQVYGLASFPAWQTLHCAALRGAELVVVIHCL